MPTGLRRVCVPAGTALLGLAVYSSCQVWPGGMAVVGWLGLISLAGFALLMLLPYAPRLAVSLPVMGGVVWAAATLV